MTMTETVSYVIFPQSMRLVIPPLASQYMNLTKNSSLAVMVGYPDLVNIGNTVINALRRLRSSASSWPSI